MILAPVAYTAYQQGFITLHDWFPPVDNGYSFGENPQTPALIPEDKYPELRQLLEISKNVGSQSSCCRAHVGCCVTDMNLNLLSVGYNKKPGEMANMTCAELGCAPDEHCELTIHSEVDVFSAVDPRDDPDGYIVVLPMNPCINCLKLMITRNVKVIVFPNKYSIPLYTRRAYSMVAANSGIQFLLLRP